MNFELGIDIGFCGAAAFATRARPVEFRAGELFAGAVARTSSSQAFSRCLVSSLTDMHFFGGVFAQRIRSG